MKSGASDPFADDEQATETQAESTDTQAERGGQDTESAAETESGQKQTGESADSAQSGGMQSLTREDLPYKLRRDKLKDERPEVHQLFVQRHTHEEATQEERSLDDRFEESLSRLDAREAIYLAGMNNLDEAETILQNWGYDL